MVSDVLNGRLHISSVDPDNVNKTEIRNFVNNQLIKYTTIDPRLYIPDDLCLVSTFESMLLRLPDEN